MEVLIMLALFDLVSSDVPARRPVVLLTDCGSSIDDQWALTHLALAPEVELKGIVTTHAPQNAGSEITAESARQVLSQLPQTVTRPPVIPGSSHPLGGTIVPANDEMGADFLLKQSKPFGTNHRLIVALIGPATDLALALQRDPTVADRITVIAMAFDKWPEGGDPWNVKLDVEAWRLLLQSATPLVVGDDAVCRRHLSLSSKSAHELFKTNKDKASNQLIHDLDHRLSTESIDTFPIWDEVVTAWVLGLTLVETHTRPRLRTDRTFDQEGSEGHLDWITKIDEAKLWDHLRNRFAVRGDAP